MLLTCAALFPGPAAAGLCDGVPSCDTQTKSLRVSAFKTEGWAFYCTGAAPYYWNWSKKGACCSVIENPFAETDHPGKLAVWITNYDPLSSHTLDIFIACSPIDPDGPTNCRSGPQLDDPKCQIVTDHSECSTGPVPVCIDTWNERCPDGTEYYCTSDEGLTFCYKCT